MPKNYFDDDKYLPAICIEPTTKAPQITYSRPYIYVHQSPELASCISQMKILIDRRFEHWIDSLNAWNSGSNTILDNGGTAAGGLASQVTNTISTSSTGAKSTMDNEFFFQKSVDIIIMQMKGDRAKWDVVIQRRLHATQKFGCNVPLDEVTSSKQKRNGNTSYSSGKVTKNEVTDTRTITTIAAKPSSDKHVLPYCNLGEAWQDLETYVRQGSFNNALLTLTENVSARAEARQTENLSRMNRNQRGCSIATRRHDSRGCHGKRTCGTLQRPNF